MHRKTISRRELGHGYRLGDQVYAVRLLFVQGTDAWVLSPEPPEVCRRTPTASLVIIRLRMIRDIAGWELFPLLDVSTVCDISWHPVWVVDLLDPYGQDAAAAILRAMDARAVLQMAEAKAQYLAAERAGFVGGKPEAFEYADRQQSLPAISIPTIDIGAENEQDVVTP